VKHIIKSLSAVLVLGAVDVIAADGQSDDAFDKQFMEEVIVSGGKEGARTMSGSAYVLDKADLEQFDFSDLNKVLSTIPGVYIRQEDGFGLRPNIGLRGVTSERSQKITLMEDGILITPAPYSAPAATTCPM
jgi:Fe(3+) dicitrate transport protein